MNYGIISIYSTQDKSIVGYKEAMKVFYEYNDYGVYAVYLLEMQKQRVEKMRVEM